MLRSLLNILQVSTPDNCVAGGANTHAHVTPVLQGSTLTLQKRCHTCWRSCNSLARPSLCRLAGIIRVSGQVAHKAANQSRCQLCLQASMCISGSGRTHYVFTFQVCSLLPALRPCLYDFPIAAVENLDDCVSINHNWLNGHNVHWTWALLQLERRQAEEGIEDCRELCRCDAAPLAHTPLCCCNAAAVLCLALRRAPAAVLPLESFVMPCLLTAWLNLRALS